MYSYDPAEELQESEHELLVEAEEHQVRGHLLGLGAVFWGWGLCFGVGGLCFGARTCILGLGATLWGHELHCGGSRLSIPPCRWVPTGGPVGAGGPEAAPQRGRAPQLSPAAAAQHQEQRQWPHKH